MDANNFALATKIQAGLRGKGKVQTLTAIHRKGSKCEKVMHIIATTSSASQVLRNVDELCTDCKQAVKHLLTTDAA
jgi:hypothetical protein